MKKIHVNQKVAVRGAAGAPGHQSMDNARSGTHPNVSIALAHI